MTPMPRNDSPAPAGKYKMTTLYEVRLVLEQMENTDDPAVLGYPKVEELDELSVFVSDDQVKSTQNFRKTISVLRYLQVEKGQKLTEAKFKEIGDGFIDACKAAGLDRDGIRFILKSLMDSFEETVDARRA